MYHLNQRCTARASVYPKGLREPRARFRRRMYVVHQRAEVIAHRVPTNSPYHWPPLGKKRTDATNRPARNLPARWADPRVRRSVSVDVPRIDGLDEWSGDVARDLDRTVHGDEADTLERLRSIPGLGTIPALVLRDERHDRHRLAEEGAFVSYARWVRPQKTAAGQGTGGGGATSGNAPGKGAFSEAAGWLARASDPAKRCRARKETKHGTAKALGIRAARLGRAISPRLRQQQAFAPKRFGNGEPKVPPIQAQKSAVQPRRRAKASRRVGEAGTRAYRGKNNSGGLGFLRSTYRGTPSAGFFRVGCTPAEPTPLHPAPRYR